MEKIIDLSEMKRLMDDERFEEATKWIEDNLEPQIRENIYVQIKDPVSGECSFFNEWRLQYMKTAIEMIKSKKQKEEA